MRTTARPLTVLSAALAAAALWAYRRENQKAAKAAVGRVRTPTGITLYGKGPVASHHRMSVVLGVLAAGVAACSLAQARNLNPS